MKRQLVGILVAAAVTLGSFAGRMVWLAPQSLRSIRASGVRRVRVAGTNGIRFKRRTTERHNRFPRDSGSDLARW